MLKKLAVVLTAVCLFACPGFAFSAPDPNAQLTERYVFMDLAQTIRQLCMAEGYEPNGLHCQPAWQEFAAYLEWRERFPEYDPDRTDTIPQQGFPIRLSTGPLARTIPGKH